MPAPRKFRFNFKKLARISKRCIICGRVIRSNKLICAKCSRNPF